jgi:hypothetical protein
LSGTFTETIIPTYYQKSELKAIGSKDGGDLSSALAEVPDAHAGSAAVSLAQRDCFGARLRLVDRAETDSP